ncbi:MAG: hypothetical protein QOH91_1023, partial [Mycobacterium sp.]|nr:hypothetical protein [Mycobacterium sp.]
PASFTVSGSTRASNRWPTNNSSTDSTLQYIHLSGRDLSAKLNSYMAQIHAWRIGKLTGPGAGPDALA